MMEHATQNPEELSKVGSVQRKVDEVKGIMSDNIEKVLSRGEKLDTLVDKTDNLMNEADRWVGLEVVKKRVACASCVPHERGGQVGGSGARRKHVLHVYLMNEADRWVVEAGRATSVLPLGVLLMGLPLALASCKPNARSGIWLSTT